MQSGQEAKQNQVQIVSRKKNKCRLPDCPTIGTQRFGLCNKHRKWVEKGNLDADTLQILKPVKRVGTYEGKVCKIPDCKNKPRRNFLCEKHSAMVSRGTLNPQFLFTTYRRKRWPTPNGCYFCRKKDAPRYVKGFCPKCYNDYLRGYIDTFGYATDKKKKRISKYTDSDICKAAGCEVKARSAGFCHNHYCAFKYSKTFDENGNRVAPEILSNKGKICRSSKCKKPAYCKLLCKKHYQKYLRNGKKIEEIKKASLLDNFDPFSFD